MSDELPVLGRIVHYVARGSADGRFPCTCRAAIVTAVDEAGQPALAVLNPEGLYFNGSLPHAPAAPLTGGTWHWPTVDEDGRRCA
ncbi:hypothetical protein ABR738_00275 [Streptomyces sp. Edi4]|uniref:hypothetical protein n=1 Tax=Streptomyces sp. Edi4 TaxID=3162527 RepID=UPI003305DF26